MPPPPLDHTQFLRLFRRRTAEPAEYPQSPGLDTLSESQRWSCHWRRDWRSVTPNSQPTNARFAAKDVGVKGNAVKAKHIILLPTKRWSLFHALMFPVEYPARSATADDIRRVRWHRGFPQIRAATSSTRSALAHRPGLSVGHRLDRLCITTRAAYPPVEPARTSEAGCYPRNSSKKNINYVSPNNVYLSTIL